MKVIKPIQLSFFSTYNRIGGDWHQFSTVIVGWDLITGDTRAEMEIWQCTDRLAQNQIPVDEFSPKTVSEFLVEGKFFSPGAQPVRAGYVEVEVGDTCKRINVFGDRYWKDGAGLATTFTEPEELLELQLDWAFAYGGEGYLANPFGKGYQRDESRDLHPLPNLELDTDQLGDPNGRPQPATFLPLRPDDPGRIKRAGTYRNDYVEKYFPGYPDDFDVSFFNRCRPDQQVPNQLTDQTRFCLSHLHPSRPTIEGFIPDFNARVFYDELIDDRQEFTEVALRPDTVWFFPEKELGVLIFHGSRKTEFHDNKNINNAVIAYERISQGEKSISHYREALKNRSGDRKLELNYLFKGKDLIPTGEKTLLALFEQDSDESLKMFAADRAEKKVKHKAAEELDRLEKEIAEIEAELPRAEPDVRKELERVVKELRENIEDLRDLIDDKPSKGLSEPEKRMSEALDRMTPRRPDGSFDIEKLDLTAVDDIVAASEQIELPEAPDYEVAVRESLADAEKELEKNLVDAPNTIQEKARDQFKEIKDKFDDGLRNLPKATYPRPPGMTTLNAMDFKFDPATEEQITSGLEKATVNVKKEIREDPFDGMEEELERLTTLSAEAKEAFENPSEEAQEFVANIREELEPIALEGDEGWHAGYVTYAHTLRDFVPPKPPANDILRSRLSTADEPSAAANEDFAGCTLENLALSGKELVGTYFEKSQFRGVTFSSSNFTLTVFAHSTWENSVFKDCLFEKANLGGMEITDCEFHDCSFPVTIFSETTFTNCRFERCKFNHIMVESPQFTECSIIDSEYAGAMILEGTFRDVSIEGSSFERLTVRGGSWRDVDIFESSIFMSMWIELNMVKTKFRECRLHRILFQRDCVLEKIDFSSSTLRLVNASGLNLSSSVFQRTSGELCDFSESVITNSVWIDVKLESCRFAYSVMTDSEFNAVRFIDANFQDADLRGSRFANCNLFSADLLHSRIGDAHFSECELGRTLLQEWSP